MVPDSVRETVGESLREAKRRSSSPGAVAESSK